MSKVDISLRDVTMKLRLSIEKVDSLKDYVVRRLKRNLQYSEFYALQDINFQVYKGERLGIVGPNGAGKSTLLKIISGIMKPTSGEVAVSGNVAPLLELGAGFDPELSGSENIYLNGAILGADRKYIDDRYEEILNFAGLGDFIHVPLKNYSSGMRARLGFAVATQLEPDILIVDEVLGVGDEQFRQKSSERMRQMMNDSRTILLVSHNIGQVRQLTDRVIWLDRGRVREIGESNVVCNSYEAFVRGDST